MKIKKKFKLIEDQEEELFLNEQALQGYELIEYDGKEYSFKKTNDLYYYLIEYSIKELTSYDLRQREKRGLLLAVKYKSQAQGYYYFFKSKEEIKDEDRMYKDRYQLLLNSKQRVDRFSAVIFVSSFTLFSYFYFKTMNRVYIIVLLLIVLLGAYFGYTYIETIKKLSEYSEILLEREDELDGNDEGCSRES